MHSHMSDMTGISLVMRLMPACGCDILVNTTWSRTDNVVQYIS